MEFSETAKANALKFLEEVASKERPSLAPHYPQLCLAEVEAECLDQAKNYLAKLWDNMCVCVVCVCVCVVCVVCVVCGGV